MYGGILINCNAWWVGAHWSPYNKRLCINLLPCITIWFVFDGGNLPPGVRITNG